MKNKIKKNKHKRLLIIGSNFAFNHYRIIKRHYDFDIHIYSPNIKKKKSKFLNTKLINNLKDYNFFHTIVCCSNPSIQKKIISKIIKKKVICKYIMLEKPICNDLQLIRSFFKFCLKNKIHLQVNFTYNELITSGIISKNLLSKTFKKINFKLHFFHHYLMSPNNSWKNFIKDGGGVINYYIIHIIFLFVNIMSKIKIKQIHPIIKKNTFYGANIFLKSKNKNDIEIDLRIDKKKYLHEYNIYKKNSHIKIYSKQKNWYKEYIYENFTKSKKIRKKINESLDRSIKKNYEKLFEKKNKKYISKYFKSLYETELICKIINNKIIKYDFKKV